MIIELYEIFVQHKLYSSFLHILSYVPDVTSAAAQVPAGQVQTTSPLPVASVDVASIGLELA